MLMPWIRQDACVGCGACVEICPAGAITLEGNKATILQEVCTRCSACMTACPTGAVRPNSENSELRGGGKWAGSGTGRGGKGRRTTGTC